VKYQTTPSFDGDWRRLSEIERDMFRRVIRDQFNPACDRYRAEQTASWPRALRVRSVEGAQGVMELTWSFAGPDGRATFEWVTIDGELAVRWRRIGGHAIFRQP
jgi:hypothetical protein